MAHEDDRSLVRRLLAGDETAFDRFFDAHAAGLYRFALTRLHRDADAAEDVVQATLSAAVRKLATYRGEAALFTWLCTFCRHEISAHYRRAGRSAPEIPLLEETPEIRAALESLVAGERPDEQLRQREVAKLVRLTLDYLPERYGDALEWKYLQELSVQEIATRLDVSPKAAESVLSRARDAFREAFAIVQMGLERREV
jgi:RNA polymerase sigma-70 factor (ECF subfamily)